MGIEGLQRLNASTLTDENNKDPANIYKLFDDQLDIKVNFRIHRMELKGHYIEFKYYADGIHSGLTPPG